MSQPCLRNMSCRCPLCMGEDVGELLALTKTISSNIKYGEDGEEEVVPPPVKSGFGGNSPPPATRKTFVANSPPVPSTKARAKAPPLQLEPVVAAPAPRTSPLQREEPADDDRPKRAKSDEPPLAFEELEAKVADKNWKIRKEVYEVMKTAFETQQGVDGGNVTELFGKMVDDSNAAAMEAGLAAVLAYTKEASSKQWSNSVIARTMPKVIDKCFAGRPGTVKLAEELVLEYVHQGGAEDTIAALLEGTKNKKPKVPPLCINSILECFKTFGPRVIPIPPLKSTLPALCESTVNNVRPAAMKLICEIYRWTGPALLADIVNGLRPAQKTEYEESIKDITPGQATVTRYVKGMEPKAAPTRPGARGGAAAAAAPAAATMDPRDFAETVDLLAKLPKTEFKAKLALPKWSEKVAALTIIIETVGSVPKLANGDYGDLVQTLKLCMQDANVNITAKAIEVLGVLADGLRKNFAQYARVMLSPLLKKLSDKKSLILNNTHHTLDMLLQHSLPIEAMMDEIKISAEPSTNKIPAARAQTILLLQRAIAKKYINVNDASLMKTLGELFASGIDDSDPNLRKTGVEAMVTLVESSENAPRMVKATLDGLEKRQPRSFKVIEAAIGPAGSSASSDTSSAPSQPASVPKAAPPKTTETKSNPKPGSGPPARLSAMKKAPGKATPAGQKPAASAAPVSTSETMTLTVAEAEQQLIEMDLDQWASIVAGFQSPKWSERKAAFETLEEAVVSNPDLANTHIEALVMYAYGQTKEFKESNVQVIKSAFQAFATFADTCSTVLPKSVVTQLVPPSIEKIGDRKISDTIKKLLGFFCEHVGPAFVLERIFAHMPSVKAPLAQADALSFISECISDFGVALCQPRAVIEFGKGPQGLESSNPKCRVAATSVFGTMYSQLGPAMLPLLGLDSWKPALSSSVEAEFKKVGYNPATAMSSISRKLRHVDDSDTEMSVASAFGRMDISAKITKELLAEMQSEEDKAAWKKRLAAMESAQRLCEEAGLAIELTKTVGELMKALKSRLSDSNANLKVKAVQVIGVVAQSIGSNVSKLSKGMGANIVSGVSDNKKNMQIACVETLNKWVFHDGSTSTHCLESLLPFISDGLRNSVGRAELLGWLIPHAESAGKLDLHCLIEPTIDCLMDKSSDAREKAQTLLVHVFRSVGKDAVFAGCRDMIPAKMRTLKPMIDKACQAAFAGSPVEENDTKPAQAAPAKAAPAALARHNSLPAPASAKVAPPKKEENPIALLPSEKMPRLDRNRKNKWIFEPTDVSDMNARKAQLESEWGPYMTPALRQRVFAVSYEKGMMEAIDDLSKCIVDQPREVQSSFDFILKWSTLRIVDNNVQALAKMLDFLVKLFAMLVEHEWELDDIEAGIFLPYLCQESGQQKPRFRLRFRDVMR
ncbi:cytoskeleton-associated protein, partial [Thraustotheca clavata]